MMPMLSSALASRRTTRRRWAATACVATGLLGLAGAAPALAQYHQEPGNDLARCRGGDGPALLVTISGVKSSTGRVRVQAYKANAAEWLAKGKWLSRIEAPAHAGSMSFCVPFSSPGTYAIAVRHDVNGNGGTDLRTDGGGMSNNPAISIFNLGKPSVTKTAVAVGPGVKPIQIQMKYMF